MNTEQRINRGAEPANGAVADAGQDDTACPGTSRRSFLGQLSALAAGTVAASLASPAKAAKPKAGAPRKPVVIPEGANIHHDLRVRRREMAAKMRVISGRNVDRTAIVIPPVNSDETLYPNRIASYTKGLPHLATGEVDPSAYDLFLKAVNSGKPEDFAAVPAGGTLKQANPQAAFSFAMMGADTWALSMPAAPAFASAETAGEMVECYWHALTRDVPFADYQTDALVSRACADLSRLSDFRGPKAGGAVTPDTLFRGGMPGDTVGPHVSQFLFSDIRQGVYTIPQRYQLPVAGSDRVTDWNTWLELQRGNVLAPAVPLASTPRYISNQRDLAEYVHSDYPAQAYVNAALILLSAGPSFLSGASPYAASANQASFVTFGVVDILGALNDVSHCALQVTWYYKWCVHRRLRPEAFGGRVHQALESAAGAGVHPDLLSSDALAETYAAQGSYLLSQCFPEGSPTHPAYPAGHAVIAGACATILKAFFNEGALLTSPVVPTADGSALLPWGGDPLTVGGEINKLASNITIGRDMAGVHYRSDGVEGMRLGEAVALAWLRDRRSCYSEFFNGFQLTKFDGTVVTV